MPFNYVISQKASLSKDGRIYVPECIRQMLPQSFAPALRKGKN